MLNGSAIAGEQGAERPTVCLTANSGRRRTGQNTGLVMITEHDQSDENSEYHDHPVAKQGADRPPVMPEAATRTAALAPHPRATGAVPAGRRCAESGGSASHNRPESPTVSGYRDLDRATCPAAGQVEREARR